MSEEEYTCQRCGRRISQEEYETYDGMWEKRKNNPFVMYEFLQEYPKIALKYFDFLMFSQFFVAPVELSQRLRQRVEAVIANCLHKHPGIVGAFQDIGVRYLPRRSDEPQMCLRIVGFECVQLNTNLCRIVF